MGVHFTAKNKALAVYAGWSFEWKWRKFHSWFHNFFYRLLVGAPTADSGQPEVIKGGAVFKCQPDAPGQCDLIPFDTKGNDNSHADCGLMTSLLAPFHEIFLIQESRKITDRKIISIFYSRKHPGPHGSAIRQKIRSMVRFPRQIVRRKRRCSGKIFTT